jgi:hypothetical protein
MADWTTISSLATAGGTLVLAIATFSAVRSSNRSARIAEHAFQVGLRPVLVPSRLEDPMTKVLFLGQRWVRVEGGHGAIEIDDNVIYMVIGVRNVGAGIAVLRGWYVDRNDPSTTPDNPPPTEDFRLQTRDIYVPVTEPGFWQGALRDPEDPDFKLIEQRVADREMITVNLYYGDHEGGQRMVSRFAIVPVGEAGWLAQVPRHWNLDRENPR